MCKKTGVFLLMIMIFINLLNVPLSTQAAESLDPSGVEEYVANYIEKNGLPGAAIVVVKDGKVLYEKGFGHDSDGKPLTAKSKIGIASGTKPFTAFAVLQLVEEGKMKLDDPIVNYLPELKLGDERWKQVTVRQLLSHTSGLPNPAIVAPANTLKEGVERLRDWKLQSDPGEKHLYSNANYWTLAYLVEQISGKEFNDYLRQNVFSPLGMNDSISAVRSGDIVKEFGISRGYVTLYGTAMPWTELEKMFSGSGSIFTTASDMGKWLSMHTNEGKNENGVQLLSQELLKESYSPQPGSEIYGFGWSFSSPNIKPARISHSGSISTFQSQQDIVPSSGYAVAVLLNSFTTTFEHAYEMSSGIIQLTEGQAPELKAPTPKIIDWSLGGITLIYLILGIIGIRRSKKWSYKRKQHPVWRFYLRLIPQLIPVVAIGWLLFIVPTLKDNSSTIIDAFGLFPAAMILLAIVFIIGLVLTILRVYYRIRLSRNGGL
ncbi:CubicO group peptidase, beta-lactamase class C family [Lentibacillus halodurans]|uniref:CubicO group peptidase, beta-lactamase class C family n=1 Tax=Lentibacillus halodurans TaxID=237679 RepID=A0A1I1AET0_9BACI|nr:serine hydrolase domain-containing protein [Lentibacillus halodurans]SFB36519.1 CubicO group peptidase, beta-lactamase class C family [Lentibacillus halodurans]